MTLGRVLRTAVTIALGWAFSSFFISAVLAITLATLGLLSDTFGAWAIRFWGRGMLRICQVNLQITGREHLAGRAKRIVTFNHTSLLDIFVVCSLLPDGGTPVAKRETMMLPFIGWGVYLLNFMAIDRNHRGRARATLSKAALKMNRELRTVIIAPEGTRSQDGRVGPFRLGAFHLAVTTRAPLVPMVIAGAHELLPQGSVQCRAGTVRVRVFPALPTADYRFENLRTKADELRHFYEIALADHGRMEEKAA